MSQCVIVIPCYNEETRLPVPTFLEYARNQDRVRFLMVNDGSTDGTARVLDGLAAADPQHFSVLHLEQNGGKAEAVRRGFLHVMDGPHLPDYVGFWDADLATPLSSIDEFLAVADARSHVEVVMGSRVQLLGHQIQRNRSRHYFGRVAATGVSLMLGIPVYDTQCGAKLFRVNESLRKIFAEPFLTRWVFDVEILARWILLHGVEQRVRLPERIHEIPLKQWMDVKGSRLKPTDFVKAPMELLRIWQHYFGFHPPR